MLSKRFLSSLFILSILSSICAFAPVSRSYKNVVVPTNVSLQQSKVFCFMGLMEDIGGFFKGLTARATASHILIKGGAEAENKLLDLKDEIDNNPVKFAEAAGAYSECPSGRSGGNLGEFGRGQMVKEFDKVVFEDEVGVVHGPVQTQFGYHLILISERTD